MHRQRILLVPLTPIALLVGYLLLWPVPIQPVAWKPSPPLRTSGPGAAHERLIGLEVIPLAGYTGPEDLVLGPAGFLYTGTEGGYILRIDPESGRFEEWANTGGRPLGLQFDREGRLVAADAVLGLLRIDPDRRIELLVESVGGERLGFANEVAIGADGRIYFTDSTRRFPARDWGGTHEPSILDLMEHRGTGRLMVYDPATGSAATLIDSLAFANGVALSADGRYAFVAETGAYRLWRVGLAGGDSGTAELFLEGLPGFPDNLSRGLEGRIWIALASPRLPLMDALAGRPLLRKIALRLPAWLRPGPLPRAHVIAVDERGRVIRDLQGSEAFPNITSVAETGDHLWLGSVWRTGIARLPKKRAELPDRSS